jgi:hypothetical protein
VSLAGAFVLRPFVPACLVPQDELPEVRQGAGSRRIAWLSWVVNRGLFTLRARGKRECRASRLHIKNPKALLATSGPHRRPFLPHNPITHRLHGPIRGMQHPLFADAI